MPTSRARPRRRPHTADPFDATLRLGRAQRAVNAHERAGDTAAALEVIARAGPGHWSLAQVDRLLQVDALRDLLPAWAYSRWVSEMAFSHDDNTMRRIRRRAFETVRRVSGVDVLRLHGPLALKRHLVENDWLFRQALLFEHGGLRHFVQGGYAAAQVRHGDTVATWAQAPLRALSLVDAAPQALRWQDVGTGEQLETLNLGAGVLLQPGASVLGRVVPGEEGDLFDAAPLGVSDEVARTVAAAGTSWPRALAGSGFESVRPPGCETTMLTDLPSHVWRGLAEDHSPSMAAILDEGRCDADQDGVLVMTEELDAMTADLVLAAVRGHLDEVVDPDPWPCVAAAAVAPGVWPLVVDRLERCDRGGVLALGQRLTGPAAALCWRTGSMLREAG